jgi:hypothetical protein
VGISVSIVTGAKVSDPLFDFLQDEEMFPSSKGSPPLGTAHPPIQWL